MLCYVWVMRGLAMCRAVKVRSGSVEYRVAIVNVEPSIVK